MAVTRPSSFSSRQVLSSFPPPSKISIWPISPAYTAPSLATATECAGLRSRPAPLQAAGGIEDLDFGIAGGIELPVPVNRDAPQRALAVYDLNVPVLHGLTL